MFEVRIHGRGGQGAVTAADLLSIAAFHDGRYALAFPSFGSERTGAPVAAFCRIDARPIRSREPVSEPDAVIVQDPTLLGRVDVLAGLRPDGCALIDGESAPADAAHRSVAVPASRIALRCLGRPLPNTALLGALSAQTGCVSLASLVTAISERFEGPALEGNVAAAREAYAWVRERARGRDHAAVRVGEARGGFAS
ncbi:2-oxoacid:acceptor oxidoreductase family protein [Phaeacidiphilus oryzae]|uniref:2-oxoacid:acceptor oxidoreductase family protein n=1 Tax=Phaeacidiphilus oryzae TaxID=348818 RepID=UPI00068FEDF9|nr:2-oxoacid:acceptor oxidoreductase family protein [Phaeacidiphilus oryzae]